MVKHINNLAEFKKLVREEKRPIIVDFTATWCGPCKMIAPEFEKLSHEFQNICFVKVDVDEGKDIATEYDVTAMPTFMKFVNGTLVGSFSGASKDMLMQLVIN